MKKNITLTVLSTALLVLALVSTLFLNDVWGDRVAQVITLCTAVIGSIALFFQFKRDKDINESNFVLSFWQSFSNKIELQKIMLKCDDMRLGKESSFTEEDYFWIVTYAQWLETLSSLINRKILSFNTINDMYNYIFFVFVNNPYVQKIELEPNKEYYQGIYSAYVEWVEYLKKNNKEILGQNTPLIRDINSTKRK